MWKPTVSVNQFGRSTVNETLHIDDYKEAIVAIFNSRPNIPSYSIGDISTRGLKLLRSGDHGTRLII